MNIFRFCPSGLRRCVKAFIASVCMFSLTGHGYAQESDDNQEFLNQLAQEFSDSSRLIGGRYSDGEELILSAFLANVNLGEVFVKIETSEVMFDFEAYVETLDFPISYNLGEQSYIGWFMDETQTIRIDLTNGIDADGNLIIVLNDRTYIVVPSKYSFVGDQLYLSESTLAELFEIKHEFNYQKLHLKITAPPDFPLLEKLKRKNRRLLSSGRQRPSFVNLPRYYELISPQILDVQLSSIYRESVDSIRSNLSIQGARDLALLHTQFSLTADDRNGLNNARLNLSRESAEGNLFGNTGITRFEVGDVRTVRLAGASSLSESLGISIQNTDLRGIFDTELITIQGDVPIGWDAELYRNGLLLDQQLSIETGRYEFVDTPLVFGQNDFEVILYGPQGQVRRETLNRFVDEQTNSQQTLGYQASLIKLNKTLFGLNERNLAQDLGYSFAARGSFKASTNSSINFGVQSNFGGQHDTTNATFGTSARLFGDALANFDLGFDDEGGVRLLSSLRTSIFNQSVSIGYSNNDITASDFDKRYGIGLSIDGNIPISKRLSIPLSQSFQFGKDLTNQDFRYTNSLGFRSGAYSFFHNLEYRRIESEVLANQKVVNETFDGSINMQLNLGRVFTRIGLNYDDNTEQTINSVRASVNWQPLNKLRATLSASKSFLNDNVDSSLSLGYISNNFIINGRVGHSDATGFDIGLNASFSLKGNDSSIRSIEQSSLASSATGSLAVRVFFDKNMNAVYDEGEILLPNVTVNAVQFYRKSKTNKDGVALIDRLINQTSSDIVIERDTLPETFLVPMVEGVSITARAGLVDQLDYPVVASSELEGIAEIDRDGELMPLNRATINLFDSKDRLVQQTRSEYDGYFVFTGIISGQYTMRISDDDATRLDLKGNPSIQIVSPEIPDIIIKDFIVKKRRYKKGFISEIGRFEKPQLATLLARMYESRSGEASYIEQDKTNGLYRVFTHFSGQEQTINLRCNSVLQILDRCDVLPIELPIQ